MEENKVVCELTQNDTNMVLQIPHDQSTCVLEHQTLVIDTFKNEIDSKTILLQKTKMN